MIKKLFKSKIFLCILTALIIGTVSVYAVTYFPSNQVTYDNKTSGLKATEVQGAIDELYSTCSTAVSSGDYLYYLVEGSVSGSTPGSQEPFYRLYRYSLKTKKAESINTGVYDPSFMIQIVGDYVYYLVEGRVSGSTPGSQVPFYRLYRYSLKTKKAESINTGVYDPSFMIQIVGDYVYYLVEESVSGSTPGSQVPFYRLYRYSLKTKKAESINTGAYDLSFIIQIE